jgi:outer membrane protein assembly factor BamB
MAIALAIGLILGVGAYALTTLGQGVAPNASALSPDNWTTYHHDLARSGFDPTPNFNSISANWVSPTLDGAVYAEPLVYGSAVFVATENDSVYALSAQTGAIEWRTHLGNPVPGSILPCGNINPSGITGTPVIDPATGTLYAVAFLNPPHHVMFAIGTQTGKVGFQRSADAVGSDPTIEQQRGALSLASGRVYIPYGGLAGDCGNYHGWVVGLKADGSAGVVSYMVPSGREAGIWAPSGAAIDSSGFVYVATGNGASTTTYDHGESVIKLSSSLQEIGFFAPSNWAQLNAGDTDVGSVGPAIVQAGILFQIGKEGVGYLLSTNPLGGIGGQLFKAGVCSGAFGGTAYASPYLFVPCTDGLVALKVIPPNPASGGWSFKMVWRSSSFNAGPPIITAGVVWTVDTSSAMIHAYNVKTGQEVFHATLGAVPHFSTPSAGDSQVFVVSGKQVAAFILK